MKGTVFINLGYRGKKVGECLAYANSLIADGCSEEQAIKKTVAKIEKDPEKLDRKEPLFFNEAVNVVTQEELENIRACRQGLSELTTMPLVEGAAMMPDACVAGGGEASICVGGAVKVRHGIIPAAHSADICCSMYLSFFESDLSTVELLNKLKQCTRFGAGGRKKSGWVKHEINDEFPEDNVFLKGLEDYARKHMADQGDGNHFAYIGEVTITAELCESIKRHNSMKARILKSYEGKTVKALVTHHGSRGLGAQLYKRGIKAAEKYTAKVANNIPKNGAWLDYRAEIGRKYWEALEYIAEWTEANHESIHDRFLKKVDSTSTYLNHCRIHNQHNFVWKRGEFFYHGKGATPAWDKQVGIIPLNMGSPILIVQGSGNKDFLEFAPHGAGRDMSRTALKQKLGVDSKEKEAEITEKVTKGIEVIWYQGLPDVSETPVAYKSPKVIKKEIKNFNLAKIVAEVKPLGCIMAGESKNKPVWKKKKTT